MQTVSFNAQENAGSNTPAIDNVIHWATTWKAKETKCNTTLFVMLAKLMSIKCWACFNERIVLDFGRFMGRNCCESPESAYIYVSFSLGTRGCWFDSNLCYPGLCFYSHTSSSSADIAWLLLAAFWRFELPWQICFLLFIILSSRWFATEENRRDQDYLATI